jgi:hypothetical protein
MDAKAKSEVTTEQLLGGIKDWHFEDPGEASDPPPLSIQVLVLNLPTCIG